MLWWLDRWLLLGGGVLPSGASPPESPLSSAVALLEMEDKMLLPFGLKHDLSVAGLELSLRLAVQQLNVRLEGVFPVPPLPPSGRRIMTNIRLCRV